MEIKECGKCSAKWINGQLFWSTGQKAEETDLAGLVCNNLGDDQCINPARGQEGGQTWKERMEKSMKDLNHPENPEL